MALLTLRRLLYDLGWLFLLLLLMTVALLGRLPLQDRGYGKNLLDFRFGCGAIAVGSQ